MTSKLKEWFGKQFCLKSRAARQTAATTPNTCRAMQIYPPPARLNLTVISPSGVLIQLRQLCPDTTSGQQLKLAAIVRLSELNRLRFFAASDTKLARRYQLVHIRRGRRMGEKATLAAADVWNNDEFQLVVRSRWDGRKGCEAGDDEQEEEELKVPTQEEIDAVTEDIPRQQRATPTLTMEQVKAVDIQLSIKNLVYHAAKLSAYVIGSGPNAEALIEGLKRQVTYDKSVAKDPEVPASEALCALGYARESVATALLQCRNQFQAALPWLIDAQGAAESTRLRNIRTLLEIVRLHNLREQQPATPGQLLQLLEMGFETEELASAMQATNNNVALAVEWICGDRQLAEEEATEGFPRNSEILGQLQQDAHFQMGLAKPNMLLAYLSILADYKSIGLWFQDGETSRNIVYMLNTFYEEKQIYPQQQLNAFLL